MSYHKKTTVIARRGYSSPSPMGGLWDDIKSGVKGAVSGAVSFYGQSQQSQGAAAALEAQNQAMAAQLAARSSPGLSTNTLLLAGGAGLALVLLLRKK
jgi:hypothetical protein